MQIRYVHPKSPPEMNKEHSFQVTILGAHTLHFSYFMSFWS